MKAGEPQSPVGRAGPFVGPHRLARGLPFLIAAAVAAASAVAISRVEVDGTRLVLPVVLLGAVMILAAAMPWARLPRAAQAAPPLLAVVAVFVLRDAMGGPASGVSFLYLLPVVWSGLYGTRLELWMVTAACLLALLIPPVALDRYAVGSEWSRVITFSLVAALIAWALRRARWGELTDPLTHLPNRRVWWEALTHEVDRSARTGRLFSVVVIDLDNFKVLNDTHGHHAGDAHLCACSSAWQPELRRHDLLARIGGEEFGVLLPETNAAVARGVVERLAAVMPEGTTFSAGIAESRPGATADDLQSEADQAMYLAKESGRNRIVAWVPLPARAPAEGASPSSG
jgi:diguanylate cyclase (GGDEF)-like protein